MESPDMIKNDRAGGFRISFLCQQAQASEKADEHRFAEEKGFDILETPIDGSGENTIQ